MFKLKRRKIHLRMPLIVIFALIGCEQTQMAEEEVPMLVENEESFVVGQDDAATVCDVPGQGAVQGVTDFGLSSIGGGAVYFFDAINRELSSNPGLAVYVGLDSVSSCKDAEKYVTLKAEFMETFGDSEDEAFGEDAFDKVALEETAELDVAVNGQSAEEANLQVNRIKGVSTIAAKTGVVEVHIDFSPYAPMECTGVMLNPHVIVTAAHCLVNSGIRNKTGYHRFKAFYFDPQEGGRRELIDWEYLKYQIYPSFAGVGNVSHDIAVIERPYAGWPRTDNSDYMRVYQHYGSKIGTTKFYGAGWYTCSGKDDDNLRWGNFGLDKHEPNYFRTEAGGSTRRPCVGDSGAPSIKTVNGIEMVTGIASQVEYLGDCKYCVRSNGKIWHTRLNGSKMDWIRQNTKIYCTAYTTSGYVYYQCFNN